MGGAAVGGAIQRGIATSLAGLSLGDELTTPYIARQRTPTEVFWEAVPPPPPRAIDFDAARATRYNRGRPLSAGCAGFALCDFAALDIFRSIAAAFSWPAD